LLELDHDLYSWTRVPTIPECGRGIFLFGIGDEIERLWLAELSGRCPPGALFVIEDDLPIFYLTIRIRRLRER
jgi:hypothetical protein